MPVKTVTLDMIREVNAKIAVEAEYEEYVPVIFGEPEGVKLKTMGRMPSLGPYVPAGWRVYKDEDGEEQTWLVRRDLQAPEVVSGLKAREFVQQLKLYVGEHPTHGIAVWEESPTHIWVRAYEREQDLAA